MDDCIFNPLPSTVILSDFVKQLLVRLDTYGILSRKGRGQFASHFAMRYRLVQTLLCTTGNNAPRQNPGYIRANNIVKKTAHPLSPKKLHHNTETEQQNNRTQLECSTRQVLFSEAIYLAADLTLVSAGSWIYLS